MFICFGNNDEGKDGEEDADDRDNEKDNREGGWEGATKEEEDAESDREDDSGDVSQEVVFLDERADFREGFDAEDVATHDAEAGGNDGGQRQKNDDQGAEDISDGADDRRKTWEEVHHGKEVGEPEREEADGEEEHADFAGLVDGADCEAGDHFSGPDLIAAPREEGEARNEADDGDD